MDADVGPDHLEEAGHEIDLDVQVLQRADEAEHLLVGVVREGDDHALDVEDPDELRKLLGPAQERQVAQAREALFRLVVDEPDEVETVLRMMAQLLRYELADVAGTEDDRVLEVGEGAAREHSCDGSARGDEDDREQPEAEESGEARIRRVRHRRDAEEQPASDRDQVQHRHEVVRRRMVGALLVEVVESVELRDDDPQGQAQEEYDQLDIRRDGVRTRRHVEEHRRGDERDHQPN